MSPVKPEDILPDDVDFVEIQNQKLRKGTVAAVLANAQILSDPTTAESNKGEALELIKSLAPSLIRLGMHHHVVWKNPTIQKIIDDAVRN